MKNIALIGMMGCGKTTCGRALAKRLGRELVDMDALIVERQGRPITEIFAAEGEGGFRDLERDLAVELGRRSGLVVACGGGLPLRPDSVDGLRRNSVLVWLRRDPGITYDAMDVSGRPLAQQGKAAFLERFSQREPYYRAAADVVVEDFTSVAATVAEVLKQLEGLL